MNNTPDTFLVTTQLIELAIVLCAVLVLVRRWVEHRARATGWALAMFGILALVVAVGQLQVKDDGSALHHGYTVALVCVLLLVPYSLVRFSMALGALGKRRHRVAAAVTVLAVAATLVSPRFPQPGEPRSTWFTTYVALVIVGWGVQSVFAAHGLWTAGNRQATVVRRRMRTLASGAVVVTLALVSSGGSGSPSEASQVISALIGAVGISLLVLAFVVPGWLRTAWRAQDMLQLAATERGLMVALTPEDVADTILPALPPLFGASRAFFVDVPGTTGPAEDEAGPLRADLQAADSSDLVVVTASGAFGCRLSPGWLVVRADALAPVFGPSELRLLERVGSFVDLALQRCRLYEQEAKSRRLAEAANAELRTLVYSVSHDLRNPIISVLGYLDVLATEHAGQLEGEGQHYLDRIAVNAQYMQSLIQDLLELSRIGRSEPAPQAVPLRPLAESVAREVSAQHPGCEIELAGAFPVVWMSELRARQLLTNLLDNAAKHGAGIVRVGGERTDSGAVLTVADDGPGIPADYREKAFEVFERLDAARSDIPGTGMGLPICRRIVESLAGAISLQGPSAWTATGTTARIELPASTVTGWQISVMSPERETVR
ncbi:MAG: Phytochrome, two-component sensor histidine kinase [Frankiales bacterium]|nr:Phytochrome, two-component sensor histidine kinase [Frankiales bacterium]